MACWYWTLPISVGWRWVWGEQFPPNLHGTIDHGLGEKNTQIAANLSSHIYLSFLSVCLCLSACLAGWLAVCLPDCLSVFLYLFISISLSLYLYLSLSLSLSVSPSLSVSSSSSSSPSPSSSSSFSPVAFLFWSHGTCSPLRTQTPSQWASQSAAWWGSARAGTGMSNDASPGRVQRGAGGWTPGDVPALPLDDPQWMLTQLTPAKYGIYVLTHPQITSIGM